MAREFTNGGCLDIGGSTQRCSWGNIISTISPVTTSFLIKLRGNGSSSYDVVWGYSNDRWYFLLNGSAGNERKLAFVFRNSGAEKSSGFIANNLTLGTWYLVVGGHDPSGGAGNTFIKVYDMTGTLVDSSSATNAFAISSSGLSLAAGYDSNRSLPVNAQFKNFRVWSRTLTSLEHDALGANLPVDRSNLQLEALCNERDGTSVRDTSDSTNRYQGTLTGNATFSPAIPSSFAKTSKAVATDRVYGRDFGTCLSFNGTTAKVQKDSQTAYNLVNYSLVGWVKGAPNQNEGRIYGEGRSSSGNPIFSLGTAPSLGSALRVFIRNDSNANQLAAQSVSHVFDNQWHHFAWTDSNGTAKLYIDGVLDGTNFNYTRGTLTLDRTNIGALTRTSTTNYLNGKIDDLVVFNTALSLSEVRNHFLSGTRKLGTVIDYKFDEGSGSVAIDASGNSSNGTITAATYTTDPCIPGRSVIA